MVYIGVGRGWFGAFLAYLVLSAIAVSSVLVPLIIAFKFFMNIPDNVGTMTLNDFSAKYGSDLVVGLSAFAVGIMFLSVWMNIIKDEIHDWRKSRSKKVDT